eukprot:10082882-Ditylum_brightwellii.AAC.1
MIRSFEVHGTSIDEKGPLDRDSQCSEICNQGHSAYYHATRATVHTTMQHEANLKYIHERKEKNIEKNNENENKKRKLQHYQVADKVNNNGTVKIRTGS